MPDRNTSISFGKGSWRHMHKQQGISSFLQRSDSAVPRLLGHYQAQVIGVVPKEHAVNVILPSLSVLEYSADRGGLKVSVMARRAGKWVGEIDLPRIGDWGIVVFPQGTHQFAVWLGSIYQTFDGLETGVAEERIDHHDSGVYSRTDPQGNTEFSHPSGAYWRIGTGFALTPRTRRRRKAGAAEAESVPYTIPQTAAPTIFLNHPAGTSVKINPDGSVLITTPAATIAISAAGAITTIADGAISTTTLTNMVDTVTGNKTSTAGGNHSAHAELGMTLTAVNNLLVHGGLSTQIGGSGALDLVALEPALARFLATYNSHTHNGSQVPDQQLDPLNPGTDHTINTRAI